MQPLRNYFSLLFLLVFRLHWMYEMQATVTNMHSVCLADTWLNSTSLCGVRSVQPLPNHFGLLLCSWFPGHLHNLFVCATCEWLLVFHCSCYWLLCYFCAQLYKLDDDSYVYELKIMYIVMPQNSNPISLPYLCFFIALSCSNVYSIYCCLYLTCTHVIL